MPTPPPDPPATRTAPMAPRQRRQAFSARRMGRYELVAELGRGGMGVVYRARDPELGRDVALKVLEPGPFPEDDAWTRFLREARAAARLHHPGIVRVYDIGEHEGCAYFTMPLVEGPTLAARIRQGPVPPETAAAWTAQVARALHHAHAQGLIHRDVKPGNILLDAGERPLLTDFGLVRQVDQDEAALTQASQVLGTPAYMSPEQALGAQEALGPLSDQYALGVVLYEQLTGRRPFLEANPAVLMRRILDEDVPPISTPGVPRALAAIADRALSRAPSGRYPSCEAMAEDLDRFQRGDPVLALDTTTAQRIRQALRRHRRPLGSAGRLALVVVALVGLLTLGLRWREQREGALRADAAEARRQALEARLGELYTAGRTDEAEALFGAFAAFEANQETPALGLAWGGLGALRAAHGDPEGALDAYANAWLLAEGDARQIDVLQDLAALLRAGHQWSALGAVAETLRALGAPQTPTAKGWARDLALVHADVSGALALTEDPVERAVIERLTRATETPHAADEAVAIDLDLDGRQELILLQTSQPALTIHDTGAPDLPIRLTLPDLVEPGPQILRGLPAAQGQPPMVLLGLDQTRVLRWDGDRLTETERLPMFPPTIASADLDGDGQREQYGVTCDGLYRVERQGAHLRLTSASAEHTATRSCATSLTAQDLDGDGREELVLGTSTWTGYDVRVLQPGPRGLQIATRRRLGETLFVQSMRTAAGPAILAWHSADPREVTNRQVFRPDEPEGEERGLHVLTLGPQGLERRALHPVTDLPLLPSVAARPVTPGFGYAVFVGDLNGDGLDEVVFGAGQGWTLVLVQHADGRLTELNLPGFFPLALVNLDQDPEQELVAMRTDPTHRVWTLGAGTQPLPLEAVPPPTTQPRPDGLSRDLAEVWDRAEALVAIGRPRAAAQRLEDLAELAQDDAAVARALLRAADLYTGLGDHARASALLLEVARYPDQAPTALEAAMSAALTDLNLTRALQAGEARLALPAPPAGLAEEVAALRAAEARTEQIYDLREGLDPDWRVRTAVGVTHRPGLGLEVLSAERAPLLDLPVRWDGGPIRVSVELEASRLDWGGMLSIGLVASGSDALGDDIILASGGGGGVLEQAVRCGAVPERFLIPRQLGGLTGRELRLVTERDPAHRRLSCALAGAGELDGRHLAVLPADDLPPGPLVLRVGGNPAYDSQATVLLQSVRLRGLEAAPTPPSVMDRVYRMLAVDQPEEALDALRGQRGAGAELARAQAYATLGRTAEADAALRLGLDQDPTLDGALGRVLRGALDRYERPLRAHLGDAYALTLWRHTSEIIEMHGEDRPAQDLLTRAFAGAEDLDPARLPDDEARIELGQILLRRASAWRREGRTTAALQDLDRAERIATDVLARAPAEADRLNAARQLSATRRERALLYLSRGEEDRAMEELLRGLGESPAPTVYADLLVAAPAFDALRSRPEWPQIVAARRLGVNNPGASPH